MLCKMCKQFGVFLILFITSIIIYYFCTKVIVFSCPQCNAILCLSWEVRLRLLHYCLFFSDLGSTAFNRELPLSSLPLWMGMWQSTVFMEPMWHAFICSMIPLKEKYVWCGTVGTCIGLVLMPNIDHKNDLGVLLTGHAWGCV